MKQKQIMINAYCNFNLGDDIFIKILCVRYPKTHFLLYAPLEYKYHFRDLHNITVYSRNNIFFRLFNFSLRKLKVNLSFRKLIAKRCDAIVHIGGSIFMQKENWNGLRIKKAKVIDKPYFVLGANFGPFTEERFYKQHYELFKEYTDICFRDNYSYELFKNLDNVRKADDIVFQLDRGHSKEIEKNIVISVIKPSFRKNLIDYDDIYFQKIKDITVYFIKKGYKVTLMSFCENEGDQEAIGKIIDIIPKGNLDSVRKYYYKSNVEEALEVISSSSYVVATRFHAMILGWLYNKPVFPISYSRKMNNVMNDIGYTGSYINIERVKALEVAEVYEGIKTNFVNINSQIESSEQHFKILDKLLLK